jgi:hypothetical protein
MQTPIDIVFPEAHAFQEAIVRLERLVQERKDPILSPGLIERAREEYRAAVAGNELTLDDAVFTLFADDAPFVRLFTAEAVCNTTGKTIKQSYRIGTDIPEAEFLSTRDSADKRLADEYPPDCFACSDYGKTRTHPTSISFTRYIPPSTVSAFEAVYAAEVELARRQVNLERFDLHYAASGKSGPRKQRQTFARERRDWERIVASHKQARALQLAAHDGDVLFVSARIKGGSLSEKLTYTIIGTRESSMVSRQHNHHDRILDLYGMKVIVKDGKQMEVAEDIALKLDPLYQPLAQIAKVGHRCVRLRGGYGIPIEFQVQSLEEYEEDRIDHRRYKIWQAERAEQAREEGLPVDAVYGMLSMICK